MRKFHFEVQWRLEAGDTPEVLGRVTLRRYADALLAAALTHVGEARIVCICGTGKDTDWRKGGRG